MTPKQIGQAAARRKPHARDARASRVQAPKGALRRGGQPHNANAQAHGFYFDQFTAAELALVAAFVADPTLDDEIWMQRVLNRRLMEITRPGAEPLPVDTLIGLAHALAIGTGRVARLLRDKRALSGEAADGLNGAISKALEELGTELGVDL